MQISTGGFFGAAVTSNGSVYCWGSNKDGRTGNDSLQTKSEIINPP